MNPHRRTTIRPGAVFGGFAILVGVFLLLRNFGYVPHVTLDVFPLLLIAFGLANLLGTTCASGRAWGGLLILGGGYWVASNMGLTPYRMRDVWPAFLIVLGVYFLWGALSRRERSSGPVSNDTVNELAVFGGGKRSVASRQFRGGEVYAFFGGHEINLKDAEIEGESAVIEATAICGGIELRVPESWDVAVEGVAIFGGYDDKTSHPRQQDPVKRLIVRGFAVFGGVEIKN